MATEQVNAIIATHIAQAEATSRAGQVKVQVGTPDGWPGGTARTAASASRALRKGNASSSRVGFGERKDQI
jgi:enoyl-CoA hydratase/carnithine racemase